MVVARDAKDVHQNWRCEQSDSDDDTGRRIHAGTARQGDALVTNGGRILGVTGVAGSVGQARAQAYAAIDKISFEGMRFRTDIAAGIDG